MKFSRRKQLNISISRWCMESFSGSEFLSFSFNEWS